MLEIVALLVLSHQIATMARRRGRSPTLFSLLLLALWFSGEVSGAVAAYVVSKAGGWKPSIAIIYGGALVGAMVGGVTAFLSAKVTAPKGGKYLDIDDANIPRSRLVGAIVGGACGILFGGSAGYLLYGGVEVDAPISMPVQMALGVGTVGALLGLVSGLQN